MEPFDSYRIRELDLTALCAAATGLLGAGRPSGDGRVSERPDARTVRYYQTIGVMDKPLRYDGRQAIYGFRHLLQLVATKVLQGHGHSLAQVQRALVGLSTDRLEAAVREDLGAETVGPIVSTPAPVLQPWTSAQVAPGVIVTIDPAQVADANQVLEQLRSFLCSRSGGSP